MELDQSIDFAISHLIDSAKQTKDTNLHSAVGEVEINGNLYQVQMSFICDKRMWLGVDDVRQSELVKLHED